MEPLPFVYNGWPRDYTQFEFYRLINWPQIDTVLLDMDGVLLDLRFDNDFWMRHVPDRFAAANGVTVMEAEAYVHEKIRSGRGTLQWYCIDYWSQELGLDIVALKQELAHNVAYRTAALEFLAALSAGGKRRVLVTNAHPQTIEVKHAKTGLHLHLDEVAHAHEFGAAKEQPEFWERFEAAHPFRIESTLFIDDNLTVLRAARTHGLTHLLTIVQPDSSKPERDPEEFPAIRSFAEIMPVF